MATELPQDHNGEPDFTIKNKLDELQTLTAIDGKSIDDMDLRTTEKRTQERKALLKDTIKDPNENDVLSSKEVQDYNDKYEVDLDNSNPMFIFPENRKNMNYVNMIRQSNDSYARERDLFAVRPPIDAQQQILDRLKNRESLELSQKVGMGIRLSEAEEKRLFESLFNQ